MTDKYLPMSTADRVIACPGSAEWTTRPYMPGHTDTAGSKEAEEGSRAHDYAAAALDYRLGGITRDELRDAEDQAHPDKAMRGAVQGYVQAVLATPGIKTPECPLTYDVWTGRADAIVERPDGLTVYELKYGAHAAVTADKSAQVRLYALGAAKRAGLVDDEGRTADAAYTVEMIVYQPRLEGATTHRMTLGALLKWYSSRVAPAIKQACGGNPSYNLTPRCQFCRRHLDCPAHMEMVMRVLAVIAAGDYAGEAAANIIRDYGQIAVNMITEWRTRDAERAIQSGRLPEGYRVAQRKAYVWAPGRERQAADALRAAGYSDDDIYNPPKMRTAAQWRDRLGGTDALENICPGCTTTAARRPHLERETRGNNNDDLYD